MGAGLGVAVKFALVFADGEFIELDVAGLADERVGMGTEAGDRPATGKLKDMSSDVFFLVDDDLAEVLGHDVEEARPAFAVLNVEARGAFVARGDPDVVTAFFVGSFPDGIEGVGESDADLAGFLDDLEAAFVVDPAGLVREEEIFHTLRNGN